jgi:hypothetical protein
MAATVGRSRAALAVARCRDPAWAGGESRRDGDLAARQEEEADADAARQRIAAGSERRRDVARGWPRERERRGERPAHEPRRWRRESSLREDRVGAAAPSNLLGGRHGYANDEIPLRLVLHRRVLKKGGKRRNSKLGADLPASAEGREGVPAAKAGIHEQAHVEGRVEGAPAARRRGSAEPGSPSRDRPRGRPVEAGSVHVPRAVGGRERGRQQRRGEKS